MTTMPPGWPETHGVYFRETGRIAAALLLLGTLATPAQEAVFLRIRGPTNSMITGLQRDGTLHWTNEAGEGTCSVQVSSQPESTNWITYPHLDRPATATAHAVVFSAPAPPAWSGQTASYYPGDDGDLRPGLPWPEPRFTLLSDNSMIVKDHLTGLEWSRNALGQQQRLWDQALAVGELHGVTGWRIPNRHELASLLDHGQGGDFALPAGHPFTDILGCPNCIMYWTSTSLGPDATATYAVTLDFSRGWVRNFVKGGSGWPWPVRGTNTGPLRLPQTGQLQSYASQDDGDLRQGMAWPTPRFVVRTENTVEDHLTGLMWTRNANLAGHGLAWTSALDACNALTLDGFDDWRLPSVTELRTLFSKNHVNPCLPPDAGFSNAWQATGALFFWSSTTSAYDTNQAFRIDNVVALEETSAKDTTNVLAWPVRTFLP